jgi:hypothetical protein
LVLTWFVNVAPRQGALFGRFSVLLGLVVASVAAMLLWSTTVGLWSRIRVWSPQWTFLVGAIPFWVLGFWVFFLSGRFEMRQLGYLRMLLLVGFGSSAGRMARKKAYPQFSDEDSPSTPLPPPTLFLK